MKYIKPFALFLLLFALAACNTAPNLPPAESAAGKTAITTEAQTAETTAETQTDTPTTETQTKKLSKPTTIRTQPTTEAETSADLRQIIDDMTLEQKVGQMFIARCPASDAVSAVKQYQPGGYILFGRDFKDKSKTQVKNAIKSYQTVSKTPMFIGADEEGGTVNRVSLYKEFRAVPFWSPQALYKSGGFSLIKSDTKEKCALLQSLGINLNFAPVCDISTNKADFIYRRSFGKPAGPTSEYVKTVVDTMGENNMGAVLKHFPGYGNNKDTHTGIAYDNRPYETFTTSDFLPFKAGVKAGAGMILVAHNVVKCMDSKYPASLSSAVHKILRNEIGFDGVVMTDDLAMDAIRDYTDNGSAAVLAVKAGNDMLCCTDFKEQIPSVISAVKSGEITEDRIEESVFRILKLKQNLNLLAVKPN